MRFPIPALVLTAFHLCMTRAARPICPSSESLSPCTCDLEGIACDWVVDTEDLRRSLDAKGGSSEHRGFWMVETTVTEIQNDTFQRYVFRNVYLPNNKIKSIQTGAFRGLENGTRLVELQSNDLQTIPLQALSVLKVLQVLVLAKNRIDAVPDEAFASFTQLNVIRLEKNAISHLGRKAFNTPQLRELNLSHNRLKVIAEQAFYVTNPKEATRLVLNLDNNEIQEILPNAFESRLEALDSVSLKNNAVMNFKEQNFRQILDIINATSGIELDLSDNFVLCGKDLEWILTYPVRTRKMIKGIECLKDGNIVDVY